MKLSRLLVIAAHYDPLLIRYARMLTKNESASKKIVIAVFEQFHDSKVDMEGKVLRQFLKSRVERCCQEWGRLTAIEYYEHKLSATS